MKEAYISLSDEILAKAYKLLYPSMKGLIGSSEHMRWVINGCAIHDTTLLNASNCIDYLNTESYKSGLLKQTKNN